MSQRPPEDGAGGLPPFLAACVENGVLEPAAAAQLDRYRRSSGTGLTRALAAADFDDETLGRIAKVGPRAYVPMLLQQAPDSRLTFETMVPFKANAMALKIARALARKGGARQEYNPLLVQSGLGLGKTHLLSAIANASAGRARLVNVADLEAEVDRATRLRERATMRYWLLSTEVLLLDDFQLCQHKDELQREIYALLGQINRRGKLMVISSSVPCEDLDLDPQLASRLSSGLVVTLKLGNRAEREQALRGFFKRCDVPDSVISYVAQQVTDNVRRLRAAAIQLTAMHESMGVDITVELARAVVPQPEDLHAAPGVAGPSEEPEQAQQQAAKPALGSGDDGREAADRFKKMLASAETEDEQMLALQIAIGERVRQMREQGGNAETMQRFEYALELLRDGNIREAIRYVGGAL